MRTLEEMLAAREALDRQITEARKGQAREALATVRSLVAQYGLSAADVFGGAARAGKGAGVKLAAKYRDPQSGKTWTGRGRAPTWLAGKDRTQFLVD